MAMKDEFSVEEFWTEYLSFSEIPLAKEDKVFIYDTIDSTNTELTRRVGQIGYNNVKALHKTLVASASQTSGKGRIGRSFYSPKKSGIYFSFLYAPAETITNPAEYTIASVVGVCLAIEKLYHVNADIKWVNDIYINGKKVCGILTEGIFNPEKNTIDAVIVGIGINIKTDEHLPEELKAKAGGIIGEDSSLIVSRSALLANAIHEIYNILDNKLDFMSDYKKRFMHAGKRLLVTPLIGDENSCYEAIALGISDDAGLIVRLDDGTEKVLHNGEVSLHNSNM